MKLKQTDSLWCRPGFVLLWSGQSVSQLGSQVTVWALPLTAVLALKATPAQMGLLAAAGSLPVLLVGLAAGAWVDRVRRRPVLIAADIGRALLLGSIPLAAWLGRLSLPHLYVVGLLAGLLTVFFDVAYQAAVPTLAPPGQLVEANSALEASASVAGIAGPGMAGWLVQSLTGPGAIALDALSFAVSALSVVLIRAPEPAPSHVAAPPRLRREIGEGLHVVWRRPILRALAVTSGLFNLFDSVLVTVYVLYLTRTLDLPPALIGLIFALGGVGGLLGVLLAGRVTRRIGPGRALTGGLLLAGAAELCIALAGGPRPVALLLVIAGEAGVQGGAVLYSINAVSLRQSSVPDQMQGRVAASMQVIATGAVPLGALLGGLVGQRYGLRATVLIAGCGTLLAFGWLAASPVRQLGQPHRGVV